MIRGWWGTWGVVAALVAWPAQAIEWEYQLLPAEGDQGVVCTAGIYYSDGPFIARVYGTTLDFYLSDDELALLPDRRLGTVAFFFNGADFTLDAESGASEGGATVDHLYLTPAERDTEEIVNRLRYAGSLEILFPDGLSYTIGPEGSNAALSDAFECWAREEGSGSGPDGGRNPFGEAPTPGRNPFE